jgi:SAM-dependent methyltransferase
MGDLHPLAHGFDAVAEEYERGRPGYPPEVVAAMGLPRGARVADVGAGTGKLTRALVAAGLDVVAVEPLAGMRAAPAAAVPGVEVLEGTAEALPLADASLDAVAIADAFHWFDGPRAAVELARVLRPGGTLAIVVNTMAGEAARQGATWAAELIDLLNAVRPEHPAFAGEGGREAIVASPDFGPFDPRAVVHVHHATRASLLDNIASMSYVSVMPEAEREALLRRVDDLLASHGVEAIEQPLRTTAWLARRL